MRVAFPGIIIVLAVASRFAAGGEVSAPPSDPLGGWKAILDSYGLPIAILIYMFVKEHFRDKQDRQKRADEDAAREKRQLATDERFHALDSKLVSLVEKYSIVVTEMQGVLVEMRGILKEHNVELRHINNTLVTHRPFDGGGRGVSGGRKD